MTCYKCKPCSGNKQMLKVKSILDRISQTKPTISWLDERAFGKKPYLVNDNVPAYRYTFITKKSQQGTKDAACAFERALRESSYPARVNTHLTRSLCGRKTYWKVEVFLPKHWFVAQ